MKTKTAKLKAIHHHNAKRVAPALFMSAFAILGSLLIAISSAATTSDPLGYADSCQLENNKTVIYGWAHDNSATNSSSPNVSIAVGSLSTTVQTSVSNYREQQIDTFLIERGFDPGSMYGFRAEFSNLFKGSSPVISGTITNVGPGLNQPLLINYGGGVDSSSKPFFANNRVPDVCLANLAVTTPPSPTTTTAPPKRPTTSTPPRTRVSTPTPTPPPVVSNAADATVTPSVVSARVAVPGGNADSVSIAFGTDLKDLSRTAEPVGVVNGAAEVLLSDLESLTTYYFAINRIKADGTIVTSDIAEFKTTGMTVHISFVNGPDKAHVFGVAISNYQDIKTTDENGKIYLENAKPGSYKLAFSHADKEYKEDIEFLVGSISPVTGILELTIDLSTLEPAVPEGEAQDNGRKSNSLLPIILVIILVIIAIGVISFLFYRRFRYRGSVSSDPSYDYLAPPGTQSAFPPPPQPTHMGESLKDLVINSMHEEAARKQAEKEQLK